LDGSGSARPQVGGFADKRGWLYVHPNGLHNRKWDRFWNATDACCNFYSAQVDDVSYISSLIDDVSALYNVDAKRVFVVGHSNGGFMAHRLACDLSDRITAVVSIAGAQWSDPSNCNPTSPVAVLQVHGDSDARVLYAGGAYDGHLYPSAQQTVELWAVLNACGSLVSRTHQRLDLDRVLDGRETRVERFRSCRRGAVELWTIEGGEHIPVLTRRWPEPIFDFLASAQP
jgi:polyhydroxybutyrate depolymerase